MNTHVEQDSGLAQPGLGKRPLKAMGTLNR